MMKKSLIGYAGAAVSVLAAAILLICGASAGTAVLTDYTNAYYMPFYQAGERGISSPWYVDGYHIVDEGFLTEIPKMRQDKHSVVSIGSSLSVISFQQQSAKLDNDYSFRFFVCGNGSWKSDRILMNLLDREQLWKDGDVAKYEVSFSTFRDPGTTITETILDKWGKYNVAKDGTLTKNVLMPAPAAALNLQLIRLQNAWELFNDYRKQLGSGENPPAVGNYKNNYFTYDAVAANCLMTEEMQQEVAAQIQRLAAERTLVVELSPLPKGLAETDYGKQLVEYQDGILIPMLEEKGIPYLDYRYDYRDEEYADGVHLGYGAGVKYTEKLCGDLNRLIGEMK